MSDTPFHIMKMRNPIQTYAWGSHSAIAKLMGQDSPSHQPQAELWMGAHPKSPSEVWFKGKWNSLLEHIDDHPQELLGVEVADRFDKTLPYLFKVLAAAEPLSIQAHPDAQQALEGFRRENLQGLPLTDPKRNYRDNRPKPECMCALTPFTGLCGFRLPQEISALCEPVWPRKKGHFLSHMDRPSHREALKDFFLSLMQLDAASTADLTARVAQKADRNKEIDGIYGWIARLYEKYPGDIGVLAPLFLNLIRLEPGEALFLPARQLHAYLDGLGIELMANSDNVLRGGLTPKHIDIRELMRILDFNPYRPEVLSPRSKSETEGIYPSTTDAFSLSRLVITRGHPHFVEGRREGPEILLGVEGTAEIQQFEGANALSIAKGESVFVPAAVDGYRVTGDAKLFKASVNFETGF